MHAATLVTAGIYLLLRSSPILEYSPTALLVITLVGATTAFFAATSGLVQNDLKRIIAFSTISQLGFQCVFLIFSLFLFISYFFEQVLLTQPTMFVTEGLIPFSLLRLEKVAGEVAHHSSLFLIKFKYPFLPVVKHLN